MVSCTRSSAAHDETAEPRFRPGDQIVCTPYGSGKVIASHIEDDLVGRNILEGRWSFQVVEEYDANYYAPFKEHELAARADLVDGRPHLFEAEMKEDRRTHGRRHHEATPGTDQ